MSVRVLVVDDHPVFRSGLRGAIEGAPDATCVAEATSGEEAVALACELAPDVVLMDLRMDGMSGVEATRRIVQHRPATRVLVLTMSDDDESLFAAVRAGASGYLLKGVGEDEIAAGIAAVARGHALFDAGVSARLLGQVSGRDTSRRAFPELSPREEHVLDLLASGLGNVAIAARLSVAPKTVRNAVSVVLAKIGAEDRAAAVRIGRAAGLEGVVMDAEELLEHCLAKPGAWVDNPFHEDHPVVKVGEAPYAGKIFAFVNDDDVGVKAGPDREVADEWLHRYPHDARVMAYIGRSGWNTLLTKGAIPDDEILDAVDTSYALVVGKLPRKHRPAGWEG